MAQRQEIAVRRAKVSDAAKIATFVNRARQGQPEIDEQAVIARFHNVGLLLAVMKQTRSNRVLRPL